MGAGGSTGSSPVLPMNGGSTSMDAGRVRMDAGPVSVDAGPLDAGPASVEIGSTSVDVGDAGAGVMPSTTSSFSGGKVTIREFSLAPGSQPLGITVGGDGNAWFVERGVDRIARITASGKLTEFSMPTKGLRPQAVTTSHAGDVWYIASSMFGRVSPDGTITEYPSIEYFFGYELVVDSSDNLWFTDFNAIGKREPSGKLTMFPTPGVPELSGLAVGPDGNLWCFRGDQALLRMTPSGAFTVFPMGAATGTTVGPDGDLWAVTSSLAIEQISIDGTLKNSYSVGGDKTAIPTVSTGPDGAIWFTEGDHQPPAIGRVTAGGAIDQFELPGSSTYMIGFAVTRDGSLWFTENDADKVGRVSMQ